MAPSNLNQVFVINDVGIASGTVFTEASAGVAFSSLAASANKGGVWSKLIATGVHGYGNAAANIATSTTHEYFQIVQGTTKSAPIATPILQPKDIKRIKYTPKATTVLHSQSIVFSAVPSGTTMMTKLNVRTAPTFYEMFSNPSNANLDLSGGAKIFPILGNFSAGRTMFPVAEIAAGTTGPNAALAFYNAVIANPTLNAMFYFPSGAPTTATAVITARHPGVIFDMAGFDTVNKVSLAASTTTGFNAGVGNYWQVISDEKAQRARYGHFNRMYFPFEQTNYAQVGNSYDCVEISYVHNWPADTGIAKAGELNNVKIYFKTAIAGNWLTWFGGLTAGTAADLYY